MANEKRLIDANKISYHKSGFPKGDGFDSRLDWAFREDIDKLPTVDAVEVVFCDECTNHGQCIPEDTFRLLRIEKPFCCIGRRKTNTNCGAKMDGDGNGT